MNPKSWAQHSNRRLEADRSTTGSDSSMVHQARVAPGQLVLQTCLLHSRVLHNCSTCRLLMTLVWHGGPVWTSHGG